MTLEPSRARLTPYLLVGQPTWQEQDLASAIAFAEGFHTRGSVPNRAHNPGDLKLGDLGWGVTGDEGITVFPDEETGWAALYHQLRLITPGPLGQSHVYTLTMTLSQMGAHWTDTAQGPWVANVCEWYRRHRRLVAPGTSLAALLVPVTTGAATV